MSGRRAEQRWVVLQNARLSWLAKPNEPTAELKVSPPPTDFVAQLKLPSEPFDAVQ